jgi:hypothetical protein
MKVGINRPKPPQVEEEGLTEIFEKYHMWIPGNGNPTGPRDGAWQVFNCGDRECLIVRGTRWVIRAITGDTCSHNCHECTGGLIRA